MWGSAGSETRWAGRGRSQGWPLGFGKSESLLLREKTRKLRFVAAATSAKPQRTDVSKNRP